MVRLSRIYTKTGDDGTTGLGDGTRTPKEALRVDAYGTVDEANAAIGLAVVATGRADHPAAADLAGTLRSTQHDLFDLGADLCTPVRAQEAAGSALRITPEQTARLEGLIDRFNAPLPALTSFVLPGGSELAASLHLARTVTRRAERLVAALLRAEPAATGREALIYLNRLSDLLFVLGRVANQSNSGGSLDVLWVPGRNRTGPE
ncbi:MAG: cob(I)yrinic acid a,c-diamide adenosyltransferase [Phycisphaerales bacterium]|nr:cob(I)yrinic acid a,c-diamide adenosyltransferase [Phycisphaerales bacterium]